MDQARIANPLTAGWLRLGVGVLAMVALYLPLFPSLAKEWASFPSLSHGFAVPPIAGYLVWKQRREIHKLAISPSWGGFPVVMGGLILYTMGTLGGEPFLARLSFPLTLLGTVLFLGGIAVAGEVLPGIGYLFFMIPLPYTTLKGLTEQSRLIDATVAAAVLPWLGVPVFQEGFLLRLPNITLEVADECSSIPAIAALLALGAAYGYVSGRPRAIRLALLVSAVPLGLMSNLVRIILTATGAYYLGPIALHNVIHMWNGATVFLMTLGALMLLDSSLLRLQVNIQRSAVSL